MTWFDNVSTRHKTLALVLAALLGMSAISYRRSSMPATGSRVTRYPD